MMTDPRTLPDPRAGIPGDPRIPGDIRNSLAEERGLLTTVCTCGLPNCPRVPHHSTPHGMTIPSEGHLVASHGLTGLPLGAAPVGHVDPAILYQMGAAYGLNESPEVMRSMPHLNGYYPYDPTAVYPYMNGYAGIDARRKNATKESTNTLKAWLYEHRKNPYPTKGEKIMLAILTKMTLTQVSTWFANARRRLKKENKVTWVTKDDDMDDDDVTSDTERANASGNSADDDNRHGSIGDDDLSIMSGDDRSEIDVEDHSDLGDEDHRVPNMLPHGLPPLYLANHAQNTPLVTSLPQRTSSPRTDQSQKSDSGKSHPETNGHDAIVNRTCTSPISRCHRSPALSPITPPPSPKDSKHSQSSPSSHIPASHVHQSSATIHHHPVTSPNSTSPRSSSSSLHTTSSPSKPKIWSIADVVSSGNSETKDSKVESSSSRPQVTGPSPIVSLGGAPVRTGGMPQGVIVPGTDGPYSLAYYPYGIPHPAAAAMMASQAASALRFPHPYARAAHALQGHPPASHLMAQVSRDQRFLTHPGLARPHPHITTSHRPGDLHPHLGQPSHRSGDPHNRISPSHRPMELPNGAHKRDEAENHHKPNSPRLGDSKCKPTAFTPVAQRQV